MSRETTTVIVTHDQAKVSRRIDTIRRMLEDHDIAFVEDEIICRNADELFLLRKYRQTRLEAQRKAAEDMLETHAHVNK